MKLLLVNGQAQENGACRSALEAVAEALREQGVETELFWPVSDPRAACSGCGACRGAGVCVNDLRPVAFVKAACDCDGFLFVAPTDLFGSRLKVDMKNFLASAFSRAARRQENPLKGKCAGFAVVTAHGSGQTACRQLRTALEEAGLRPTGEETVLSGAESRALQQRERPESLMRLAQALACALR